MRGISTGYNNSSYAIPAEVELKIRKNIGFSYKMSTFKSGTAHSQNVVANAKKNQGDEK